MPTFLLLDKTRAKLLAILTLQKADEISPDECGIEEWTDRRIDTGITGGCRGMLWKSALLPTQQQSDTTLPFKAAAAAQDDSESQLLPPLTVNQATAINISTPIPLWFLLMS